MKIPERSHVLPEKIYEGIDPGIRFAVRVLNAAGIETCQSCQGGEGHSYDRPSIDLRCGSRDSSGFSALSPLRQYGLPVRDLARLWRIEDGLPYESLWRITFARPMEDRADDKPIFSWHYEATTA